MSFRNDKEKSKMNNKAIDKVTGDFVIYQHLPQAKTLVVYPPIKKGFKQTKITISNKLFFEQFTLLN